MPGGRKDPMVEKTHTPVMPVLVIPESMLITDVEIESRAMIQVKDPKVISNFKRLCFNEGFLDIGVRYVGGRYLLLDFPNKQANSNFGESEALMNLVKEKRQPTKKICSS